MDYINLQEAGSHTEAIKLNVKRENSINSLKNSAYAGKGLWHTDFAISNRKERAALLEKCQTENIIQHSVFSHLLF